MCECVCRGQVGGSAGARDGSVTGDSPSSASHRRGHPTELRRRPLPASALPRLLPAFRRRLPGARPQGWPRLDRETGSRIASGKNRVTDKMLSRAPCQTPGLDALSSLFTTALPGFSRSDGSLTQNWKTRRPGKNLELAWFRSPPPRAPAVRRTLRIKDDNNHPCSGWASLTPGAVLSALQI